MVLSTAVPGIHADPILKSGDTLNAFEPAAASCPYWFGRYYNLFSATSRDGSTPLMGQGSIGVNVLGADCTFQLVTFGSKSCRCAG